MLQHAVLNTLDLSSNECYEHVAQSQEFLLRLYQAMLEYGIHLRDLVRCHGLHQQLLARFHPSLNHLTYEYALMFFQHISRKRLIVITMMF